jgi:hypothetical protein
MEKEKNIVCGADIHKKFIMATILQPVEVAKRCFSWEIYCKKTYLIKSLFPLPPIDYRCHKGCAIALAGDFFKFAKGARLK